MSGRRLVVRIVVTLVAILVGVPALVIGAARLGLDPRHWSGTRLSGVELPLLMTTPQAAPEPANVLLSSARDQDENDSGDLAPSYWDPGAGRVMLGAVTDAGAQRRERLGRSSGAPYEVVRRRHSSAELQGLMDSVITEVDAAFLSRVDGPNDRVELGVRRLDHSTLSALSRHGDALALYLNSFAPPVSVGDALSVPEPPASWWTYADPVGTWLTLMTGFPLYLGGVLAALAVWWALAVRRQRRLPREVPTPTS